MELSRCGWSAGNALYEKYHDHEWGTPEHKDQKLFEFLILEGAQAGLSWITVLKKRECYREVMKDFDALAISGWGQAEIDTLMQEPGIIRNRRKLESTVQNALAFLRVKEEFGSFDRYIWRFVGGEPLQNDWKSLNDVPAQTPTAQQMSKDLKKRGFVFVGPTICYAFMQAVGMVNDHIVSCFRHSELKKQRNSVEIE
jgi:DNA-3-methyladenine glycosylase I